MADEIKEFCWRCHGHRRAERDGKGVLAMISDKCLDAGRCSKEMADKVIIGPTPARRPKFFDLEELDRDSRHAAWAIMGAVAIAVIIGIFLL